jgi:hypothetical protein
MAAKINPQPGMVLCVRTNGTSDELIRFGAALLDEDDLENHVAVLDHITPDPKGGVGTWWAIEGRPGGVGWVDASAYLSSPWTISNQGQKLTDEQQQDICKTMQALIGTPYDWEAIEEAGMRDLHMTSLHLPELWSEKWHGVAPGHVICSSAAVWGYMKNGADYPKNIDQAHVQPADWSDFIILNGYQQWPPLTKLA